MKSKKQYNVVLILGIITLMILTVFAGFVINTIDLVKDMANAQPMEKILEMKNSNDEVLLEELRVNFQQQDSVISTTKGIITIKRQVQYKEFIYPTVWYSGSILVINIIHTTFLLLVLILIRKVLSSAFEGKVFILENVKRVQKIRWALYVFAIFLVLEGLFSNMYFSYFFNSSVNRPIIDIDFRTISYLFYFVLIVYGLSEIFRIGVNLKEENDLTV